MNRTKIGAFFLCVGAIIGIITALAHLSCIFLGEDCYRSQMAPEFIIRSAVDGTLLAPIATIIVSSLFLVCGLYALSAANIMVRLPFMSAAIHSISAICVVRGFATIPLILAYPEEAGTFVIVAGLIWFSAGVLFIIGFRLRRL